jgi:HEPN domain-containing protein
MSPSVDAWMQKAEEDLRLAEVIPMESLLTGGIAFHAQQCIEKSFKALLLARTGVCPRIHDLVRLSSLVSAAVPKWEYEPGLLDELTVLYTDARYPGDFGLLPSGRPSVEDARRFRTGARAIFESALRQIRTVG